MWSMGHEQGALISQDLSRDPELYNFCMSEACLSDITLHNLLELTQINITTQFCCSNSSSFLLPANFALAFLLLLYE